MGKNILICDDAAFMRMMIKDILSKNGYNVIGEAENARDAINKAKIYMPNIVLLDLGLPDMSGIKAIKEIQDMSPNSKIIILSSHNNEEEIEKALSLGAYAYIIKDINTEQLLYIN